MSGASTLPIVRLFAGDVRLPRRLTGHGTGAGVAELQAGGRGHLDCQAHQVPDEAAWSGPVVAIVGQRAATSHALATARQMAQGLSEAGVRVVSGGALGIDGAAHRGALDAGAPTDVVLGTGVEHWYPARHAPLFTDVIAGGGALWSMAARTQGPRAFAFVARNRIIAAMADAVLVVEATKTSGALHTARAAHGLERRVLACPGSEGTDGLLDAGAWPVTSVADVLGALVPDAQRQARALAPVSATAQAMVGRLVQAGASERPVRLTEDLCAGESPRAARVALAELELAGWLARAGGDTLTLTPEGTAAFAASPFGPTSQPESRKPWQAL